MASKKSAPLDPKVADKLLDLLSTDNEFRRLFKKDPNAALKKMGLKRAPSMQPEESLMACTPVKHIAPKQELAAARDQLRAHIVANGVFTNPHCFEAGKVVSSLRRK